MRLLPITFFLLVLLHAGSMHLGAQDSPAPDQRHPIAVYESNAHGFQYFTLQLFEDDTFTVGGHSCMGQRGPTSGTYTETESEIRFFPGHEPGRASPRPQGIPYDIEPMLRKAVVNGRELLLRRDQWLDLTETGKVFSGTKFARLKPGETDPQDFPNISKRESPALLARYLATIDHPEEITELNLRDFYLTDAVVLGGFPKLRKLEIVMNRPGDLIRPTTTTNAASLSALTNVEDLTIAYPLLNTELAVALSHLPRLKRLTVETISSHSPVELEMVSLSQLEELTLDRGAISLLTSSIAEKSNLPKLHSLTVYDCPPDLAVYSQIASLPVLRELRLVNPWKCEPLHLAELAQATLLEDFLVYSDFHDVRETHLEEISKFKSLRSLNIRRTGVGDLGLGVLAELPRLESLAVPMAVSSAAVDQIVKIKSLKELKLVSVDDRFSVPLEVLKDEAALRGMPEEEYGYLSERLIGKTLISETYLARLRRELPSCSIIIR